MNTFVTLSDQDLQNLWSIKGAVHGVEHAAQHVYNKERLDLQNLWSIRGAVHGAEEGALHAAEHMPLQNLSKAGWDKFKKWTGNAAKKVGHFAEGAAPVAIGAAKFLAKGAEDVELQNLWSIKGAVHGVEHRAENAYNK